MRRFIKEARAVSALKHPNILTVYEFRQALSTCFIATEFVDCVGLRWQMTSGRVKLHEVLDIRMQIAVALDAAHRKNFIHRDFKPENDIVRRDHIIKVPGFGLAKLTPDAAAIEGQPVDTDVGTRVRLTQCRGW